MVALPLPGGGGPAMGESVSEPSFVERLKKIPKIQLGYLILILVGSMVHIGCTIGILVEYHENVKAQDFGILVLYLAIVLAVFAVDAVLLENVFQFGSSIIASCVLAVYVLLSCFGMEIPVIPDKNLTYFWGISTGVFQLAVLGLIYSVKKSFGFRAFHKVGANFQMQNMLNTSLVCESLLKLDAMIAFLLTLMAYLYLNSWSDRSVISICASVFTLSWSSMLFYALRREDKCLLFLVSFTSLIQPGYVIWKLVDFQLTPSYYSPDNKIHQFAEFMTFGVLYAIIRTILLFYLFKMYKIFGQGLNKPKLQEQSNEYERVSTESI